MFKYILGFIIAIALITATIQMNSGPEPFDENTVNKDCGQDSSDCSLYRLQGAILFADWDQYRVNLGIVDLLFKPINEIIRKADVFAGASELDGSISIKLPEGAITEDGKTEITILDTKKVNSFHFAAPRYFNVEFLYPNSNSKSLPSEFTFTCNMDQEYNSTHGERNSCTGERKFKAFSSTMNSAACIAGINSIPELDLDSEKIASALACFGWDKFPVGSERKSTMAETIQYFLDTPLDLGNGFGEIIEEIVLEDWLDMVLDPYLIPPTGIFMESLSIEKVKRSISDRKTPYHEQQGYWEIDNPGDNTRLYGQLYVLPEAKILSLEKILKPIVPDLNNPLIKLSLPVLTGPSYPLFDLLHNRTKEIQFRPGEHNKNLFNVLSVSDDIDQYVVFSNLWDHDASDINRSDCLSKGDAFGFDLITLEDKKSIVKLSDCNATLTKDISAGIGTLGNTYHILDQALYEYELFGTLTIFGTDGNASYEPYTVDSLNGITLNIKEAITNTFSKTVWNSPHYTSERVAVDGKETYTKPYSLRFLSNQELNSDAIDIISAGIIKEYDGSNENHDELIGDLNVTTTLKINESTKIKNSGDNKMYAELTITLRYIGNTGVVKNPDSGKGEETEYSPQFTSIEFTNSYVELPDVELKVFGGNYNNVDIDWKTSMSLNYQLNNGEMLHKSEHIQALDLNGVMSDDFTVDEEALWYKPNSKTGKVKLVSLLTGKVFKAELIDTDGIAGKNFQAKIVTTASGNNIYITITKTDAVNAEINSITITNAYENLGKIKIDVPKSDGHPSLNKGEIVTVYATNGVLKYDNKEVTLISLNNDGSSDDLTHEGLTWSYNAKGNDSTKLFNMANGSIINKYAIDNDGIDGHHDIPAKLIITRDGSNINISIEKK